MVSAGRNVLILVTGGTGQLAQMLAAQGGARVKIIGRPTFDFERPETIATALALRPALVVNAAAWTAVDGAEAEPDAAAQANRDGPATLAALCADLGVPLVHLSTDYVFDGAKGAPYVETDRTAPTGVYGQTKLEGEQAVLAACPQAVVLRTSWVYASVGKNFVRTMLGAAQKTSTLRVVADQHGCPTCARDLADAVLTVAGRVLAGWEPALGGVFHAAGTGDTTWHGLAEAVFAAAVRHGRARPTVVPIATTDWPTPAHRPPDSRLDCSKLARVYGVTLPPWQGSVQRVVDELLA